jgi:hypothetical protein
MKKTVNNGSLRKRCASLNNSLKITPTSKHNQEHSVIYNGALNESGELTSGIINLLVSKQIAGRTQ